MEVRSQVAAMIAGKRILIVVPARGGSQGLPLKNLCKVGGMTLVAWTARVIKSLPWVDRAVVSTDYEEIAGEAESAGLAAPFRRPRAISGDRIGDTDVLIHALQEMERIDDHNYDVVVMLPPTCPLRQPSHVTATVEMLVGKQLDAVWTVSPTDLKFHPLKQLVVSDNGRMTFTIPQGPMLSPGSSCLSSITATGQRMPLVVHAYWSAVPSLVPAPGLLSFETF